MHLAGGDHNYFRFSNSYGNWKIGNSTHAFVVYGGDNYNTGVYISRNATSWTSNSDERIKKNIVEMTNCLDNISNIRPVYFNFKDDGENQPRRIGFIAQEWQEHYPEVVSTTNHPNYDFDVLGLVHTETIPVFCGAIKELKTQLDMALARIEALENSS
jgi:hypothetical protein